MVRALRLLRAIEDGEAIRERRDRKSGCRALWPSHSPLRNGPHGDTPQPTPSFTKCVPEPIKTTSFPRWSPPVLRWTSGTALRRPTGMRSSGADWCPLARGRARSFFMATRQQRCRRLLMTATMATTGLLLAGWARSGPQSLQGGAPSPSGVPTPTPARSGPPTGAPRPGHASPFDW